jgi:hypothetical protein
VVITRTRRGKRSRRSPAFAPRNAASAAPASLFGYASHAQAACINPPQAVSGARYGQIFLICAKPLQDYGGIARSRHNFFMRWSHNLSHRSIDFGAAPNYLGVVMEKERSRDSRQRKGQMTVFVGP